MSETIIAKRYAQALFHLGQERSKLEEFESELRTLQEVLRNNQALYSFLQHPRITLDQKKQLVNKSFQSFSEEVVHTLNLLLDRHREEIISAMVDQFLTLMNETKGIADAKVYSVRALSEGEKKRISKTFAPKVGKQTLNITNYVDRSLIGGLRVRIGNRIFDGSVSGKLNRIERELVSNK